ncbi:plasmid mobilization relaxosome protein MobC [Rhodothermus sp. AH-315-K08]|nr:plasmid mobilization relaxosome protein MobC [Rhodothermus sp. AH-315-K08]
MQTLAAFLSAHGVTDQTPIGEISYLKSLHRRQYKREYRKAFNQKRKAVRSYYNAQDFARLKRAAAAHNLPWASFQKVAALAYMEKSFVVPNEETLHDLVVAMRRIGNNVNQIAHQVNTGREAKRPDIIAMNDYLDRLEKVITDALEHPPERKE